MAAYFAAYYYEGRVYAPVSPFVTRVADRVWFDGGDMVVELHGRRVRIKGTPVDPAALHGLYVPVGAVLRALGASVRYEPSLHRMMVQLSPRTVVVSPSPFNAGEPQPLPTAVFSPTVLPTPRPVWTGSPLPRRTALPFPPRRLP
jgi:hypothetical protein